VHFVFVIFQSISLSRYNMSGPQLTIYSYANNPRVWKSLIAAKYNGVSISYNTEMKFGETNKTEAFLSVNPFGQVPTAFVGTTQEQGVFESNSIARYVARLGESKHALYGKDILTTSRIDSFIDAVASGEQALIPWMAVVVGWNKEPVESVVNKSKDNTKKWLSGLELHLSKHEYLVGNDVTLADIILWCNLSQALQKVFDAEYRKQFPHIMKWFNALYAKKEFSEVAGEIKLL